jgi:hypothetical protein
MEKPRLAFLSGCDINKAFGFDSAPDLAISLGILAWAAPISHRLDLLDPTRSAINP